MTIPNRTVDIITIELRLALRRGTADILNIGRPLAEAKEKIPHGNWLPWLKNEVSMSERSAQKYIKAADFAVKYEHRARLETERDHGLGGQPTAQGNDPVRQHRLAGRAIVS
jgi:hypothetical protein